MNKFEGAYIKVEFSLQVMGSKFPETNKLDDTPKLMEQLLSFIPSDNITLSNSIQSREK